MAVDPRKRDDDELRIRGVALAERKFNPAEPRIPGGEHGGEWTVGGAIKAVVEDLLDAEGDLPPVEPSVIASVRAGSDYHVRAVRGVVDFSQRPDGEPASYVEVVDDVRNVPGEGGFLYSAADARALADGIDAVAAGARATTPPAHPANLDAPRPAAYVDGPALLTEGHAGGYPIAAYFDAYDDLGVDGAFLAVGDSGDATAEWDVAGVRPNLSDASIFANALRDMAGRVEAAS